MKQETVKAAHPDSFFSKKASHPQSIVSSVQSTLRKRAAIFKLAKYGAGVLIDLKDGFYLLEENTSGENKGKLRPAGGGWQRSDKDLGETIRREIHEELDIDDADVRLLGYIPDGDFKGCAIFEMDAGDLKPGTYSASNSKYEKVKLVKAKLSDPRYVGPKPAELSEIQPEDTCKE